MPRKNSKQPHEHPTPVEHSSRTQTLRCSHPALLRHPALHHRIALPPFLTGDGDAFHLDEEVLL
jgi:hypothetical protein